MIFMMNRVVLVGRLTKDVELKYTPSGVAVASFTLAVNRPFTNQSGEREADFINIVVWRRPAENCANFLKKGSLCGIDGRIQTRNFEGQDGRRVFMTEVVAESVQFLEPRSSNSNSDGGGSNNSQPSYGNNTGGSNYGGNSSSRSNNNNNNNYTRVDEDPFANDGQPIDISDDDLPF
jgi:single-strand DNA-binding protein